MEIVPSTDDSNENSMIESIKLRKAIKVRVEEMAEHPDIENTNGIHRRITISNISEGEVMDTRLSLAASPSLSDLLADVTAENCHAEVDFGNPKGDELL